MHLSTIHAHEHVVVETRATVTRALFQWLFSRQIFHFVSPVQESGGPGQVFLKYRKEDL